MKRFVDRKWVLEIGILVSSFILFVLNDWIFISTVTSFSLGIIYYLVLYTHAQLNRFYVFPLLLQKRNVYLYGIFTLLGFLIFAAILTQIAQLFLYKVCFLHNNPVKLSFRYQFGILVGSYICIAGTSLFVEYYRKQRKESRQEILSNRTKIDLLNKQLNPHFLFNTLNTIYGLSIEFPERTPDTIIKVSDLLRYQLESSSKESVSLRDEINFIESYISIERERIGYRCEIQLNVDIDRLDTYSIAPMIVFTFVENAFKHGTDNIKDNFITIDITAVDAVLKLKISNSLAKNKRNIVSTKVGLENTQARLQLIYPESHMLTLTSTESQFDTFLQIAL